MTTNSIRSTHLPLVLAMTLAAAVGTAPTFAHEEGQRAAGSTNPAQQVTDGGVNADVAAAVATVERFSTALSAGEIDRAVAELDPKVLIYESGAVEQSRDEYLRGHAGADAEFLKGARVTLKDRSAYASGDLAWVSSQSEIRTMKGAEPLTIDSIETMVLHRGENQWKIMHIHWSSRRAGLPPG